MISLNKISCYCLCNILIIQDSTLESHLYEYKLALNNLCEWQHFILTVQGLGHWQIGHIVLFPSWGIALCPRNANEHNVHVE